MDFKTIPYHGYHYLMFTKVTAKKGVFVKKKVFKQNSTTFYMPCPARTNSKAIFSHVYFE